MEFPKKLIQTAQVPKLLDSAKRLPKLSTLGSLGRNVTGRRQTAAAAAAVFICMT